MDPRVGPASDGAPPGDRASAGRTRRDPVSGDRAGPERDAHRSAGLDRFTPVAGTLGFVLMMVCGFAFGGWAWSWLFLMLPALTSTLGRPDRG